MSKYSFPAVQRVYRNFKDWECVEAGMYDSGYCTQSDRSAFMQEYAFFLSDLDRFQEGIDQVFKYWPVSCENFLTDNQINRIAWLGQASACVSVGLPCCFCGGFWLLTETQQREANSLAHFNIRKWIIEYKQDKKKSEQLHRDVARQVLFNWYSRGGSSGIVE